MTTSSGTSIHTQVRLTGGLPVRFARRGAPAPDEPVPAPASTSTAGRTARPWLNVDAWCEALFASALQRSAAPTAEAWPRRSVAPCAGSVPAAASAGWHKSSATTPRRPLSGCPGSASLPPRRLSRRPVSPGPRPPAWRDHPRQLLTSATSTEGTRHSEADTGPAAPAATPGRRTAACGIPRSGHPPGTAGLRTRRTEDAITDDLPRR